MASSMKNRSISSSSGDCVLCCEPITTYSVGRCDHPTCFRCASRMRVLVKQKYCAVCRADMPLVVFTDQVKPFKDITSNKQKRLRDHKYGIQFESAQVREKFEALLMFQCTLCNDNVDLGNFDNLRSHTRKQHNKQYCSICVQKLHIFPKEFRCYSREELIVHRRTGDPDNTSYKGHPECRFCDDRYLDDDELLSHLRKNHFWCHFCEKDGKQEYYDRYPSLRDHFRNEHFLCEEDNCKTEEYTAVFRNKLDLQAHVLEKHPRGLSKQQAKRQRNVDIQLDYKSHRNRPHTPEENLQKRKTQSKAQAEPTEVLGIGANGAAAVDLSGQTDLEALYQPKSSPVPPRHQPAPEEQYNVSSVESDFPSLHLSASDPVPSWNSKPNPTTNAVDSKPVGKQRKKATDAGQGKSWNKTLPNMSDAEAFPGLPTTKTKRKTNNSDSRASKYKDVAAVTKSRPLNNVPPPGLTMQSRNPPNATSVPPTSYASKSYSGPPNAILNSSKASPKVERPAPSMDERNSRLVQMIQSCLNEEQLLYFRELSAQFRRSEIPSKLYYEDMSLLFGRQLKKVFSELVSLLPDPKKQEELLELHNASKVTSKLNGETEQVSGSYRDMCKDPQPAPKATVKQAPPNPELDFPALPLGNSKKKSRNYRTPTHISMPSAWGSK